MTVAILSSGRRMLRRTLFCLPCALLVTSACAGRPTAEPGAATPPPAVAARAAGDAKQLNLLSGRRAAPADRPKARRIGAGSYACTPAGFGQKSRCRRR